jgi:hypothetical protein
MTDDLRLALPLTLNSIIMRPDLFEAVPELTEKVKK